MRTTLYLVSIATFLAASPLPEAHARGEVSAAFTGTATADAEHPPHTGCVTSIRIETLQLPADSGEMRVRAGDAVTITVDPKAGYCPLRGQKIAGTLVFAPVQYHGGWDTYYGQNLRW